LRVLSSFHSQRIDHSPAREATKIVSIKKNSQIP
jgi:hypothetical protein